ncbi:unnamed protein product [Arctogadus glacialis]
MGSSVRRCREAGGAGCGCGARRGRRRLGKRQAVSCGGDGDRLSTPSNPGFTESVCRQQATSAHVWVPSRLHTTHTNAALCYRLGGGVELYVK